MPEREDQKRKRLAAASSTFPPVLVSVLSDLGLHVDPENLDYSSLLETICGTTDDSQPVEQYDGTLGVSRGFVDALQAPVGQIQWNDNLADIYTNPGSFSGARWCSGTLISYDLFLTAGHCFDSQEGVPRDNATNNRIPPAEIARNMHVNFNFQEDPDGNPRPEQQFTIMSLLEHRLGGLDYAIVRLNGSPGVPFGINRLSNTDAAVDQMICIIGHPAGGRKRVEAGPVTDLHDNEIGYNDIDTLGGNSGSGIIRSPDGTIVGVHTHGGCGATPNGHNHGQRISSLRASSPIIRRLSDDNERGDMLHLSGVTREGRLWHTIKFPVVWTPFGDVEGQAGDRGFISDVACIHVSDDDLHVCAVSSDGRLWHTIRRSAPNPRWEPFGDVEGQAGERGMFQTVSVSGRRRGGGG